MPQSKSNLFLWLNRALVPLASALSLTLVTVNLVQAGGHRQTSNGPPCQILDLSQEFYPATPLNYPRTSTRYSVQYSLNGGPWTTAKVHMSVYGQSMASPYHTYSKYTNGLTSMSFVNLPMANDSKIDIRVEKRWGAALPAKQFVTARPSVKPITIEAVHDRTVRLSTFTGDVFNGDQFILWYDSLPTENSAVEGLAFFLNPPTTPPSGTNVKVVRRIADLKDVSKYDTLDFEGTVGHNTPYVFDIPSNIKTVYLGDTAWLRGKIRFEEDGTGQTRKMYGNGVIDASRFDYSLRQCRDDATWFQWGWQALSFGVPSTGTLDSFEFDGFAVVDYNYYGTAELDNAALNNVKLIGWNGNNDGYQFGDNTYATNIFVRTGDDSLKMWGQTETVKNATVWQNYNGGVVNMGWGSVSTGTDQLIDGVYVVKTDWHSPTKESWTADLLQGELNSQNNAIFDSMMIPGTNFGNTGSPALYQNFYIEDAPQVLFSVKILPPDLGLNGLLGKKKHPKLDVPGNITLTIQNVSTPPSIKPNSFGFQTILDPVADSYPELGTGPYTLFGNIAMTFQSIQFRMPDGTVQTLSPANEFDPTIGNFTTNGSTVSFNFPP